MSDLPLLQGDSFGAGVDFVSDERLKFAPVIIEPPDCPTSPNFAMPFQISLAILKSPFVAGCKA